MTTVVGQCIGAERKKEAQFYASHILFVSFLLEAGLAVAAYVWSGQITGFYRLTEETVAVARQLICFHSLICGVTWVFAFNIPCVLKASSDVEFCVGNFHFSMWTFRVGCSYLFREFPDSRCSGCLDGNGTGLGFLGNDILSENAQREMDGEKSLYDVTVRAMHER